MVNNAVDIDSNMTQPGWPDMVNAGLRHAQWHREDTEAFIARYLEIHELQARSARLDLDRLRYLIDDASGRLMSSFNLIGAYSESCMEAMPKNTDVAVAEINQAVDAAVSALQFQDMANQLVGHAIERIALLEKITESLARLPGVSADELTQALASTACARSVGPVEQACMAGGSVDLF